MGTVKIRLMFSVLVVNFWINAVTIATSHLMTGRCIPNFDLNSIYIFHTSPHHGNDDA